MQWILQSRIQDQYGAYHRRRLPTDHSTVLQPLRLEPELREGMIRQLARYLLDRLQREFKLTSLARCILAECPCHAATQAHA